ncbi:MAG: universal stress protein [Desulfobacteraceae bacterium]|nr:universal stress protein [Desulfobacteraceae bacterium]MBU4001589.1 universal stress protein [Pseudomonadota bacterium]MBU4055965.1 universal stress protein [Pseudomonadota bacterium]
MFKKILFATTASPACDAAAKVAFDLTAKLNANLHVFHVFGYPSRGYSPFAVDVRTGEEVVVEPDYLAWVEEEMKNTYAAQMAGNKNITIRTQVGQPHTEILKTARKEEVDLIIMGSNTREDDIGATRFRQIAGSTMEKVVRSARCPVLIVSRPCRSCTQYFSNIILGTDFSGPSYHAFLFAVKMARAIGSRLYIFHALDIRQDVDSMPNQEEIEMQILKARKKMQDIYLPKLSGLNNYEIAVWEGIPYVEILKYAREKQGDLIIMAHHTREGDPEKTLLGATVEQVVLRSACPVISINRPEKIDA